MTQFPGTHETKACTRMSSVVCNSKKQNTKTDTLQMSIDSGKNRWIMVCLNMEYYTVMKTNDLQLKATTWMNCTNVMRERSPI